jgi:hypothetical protein
VRAALREWVFTPFPEGFETDSEPYVPVVMNRSADHPEAQFAVVSMCVRTRPTLGRTQRGRHQELRPVRPALPCRFDLHGRSCPIRRVNEQVSPSGTSLSLWSGPTGAGGTVACVHGGDWYFYRDDEQGTNAMSPIVNWEREIELSKRAEWFDVSADDFSALEIRAANERFSFFYDSIRKALVKQFLLDETAHVVLLCEVRLIAKDGRFSPRIRLMRANKPKMTPATEEVVTSSVALKASVSTDGGHENFMRLMSFVLSLEEVDAGVGTFHMANATDAEIIGLLHGRDRNEIVPLVASLLQSSLTEREISLINNRKGQIAYFERLLSDATFFADERARTAKGPEALWQSFFEDATWIFGYGLSLVGHDSIDSGKLEQITTGANLWAGAGKRSDAVMRSRAVISTLLFCEIKRHDTRLLKLEPYRKPDVYAPSEELVGGVAQLQKTVRKAYRSFLEQIKSHTAAAGSPTGLDFSTTKARQVLLVGDLTEFRKEHGVNGERMESFELFRRAHSDIDIITFDELLARASS